MSEHSIMILIDDQHTFTQIAGMAGMKRGCGYIVFVTVDPIGFMNALTPIGLPFCRVGRLIDFLKG